MLPEFSDSQLKSKNISIGQRCACFVPGAGDASCRRFRAVSSLDKGRKHGAAWPARSTKPRMGCWPLDFSLVTCIGSTQFQGSLQDWLRPPRSRAPSAPLETKHQGSKPCEASRGYAGLARGWRAVCRWGTATGCKECLQAGSVQAIPMTFTWESRGGGLSLEDSMVFFNFLVLVFNLIVSEYVPPSQSTKTWEKRDRWEQFLTHSRTEI